MYILYEKISNIFADHLALNEKAMIAMQCKGYNGFKRLHRYSAKRFLKYQICLGNDLFDMYRKKMNIVKKAFEYDPMTLKEHLANWDLKLESGIKELGELNKEHFEKCGRENKVIQKAMCLMLDTYEKTGRWYRRFEETAWSAHDIHYVDTLLHKKMKHKEERGD